LSHASHAQGCRSRRRIAGATVHGSGQGAPLSESDDPETASETAANVGIELSAGKTRIVYIPGAAAVTPAMLARIEGADIVFFDGTLFRDGETITTGTGARPAAAWGHMPIDGEDGSLAALEGLTVGASMYTSTTPTRS
jgi:pyrroloquinoline quinone biosynthesis protein B